MLSKRMMNNKIFSVILIAVHCGKQQIALISFKMSSTLSNSYHLLYYNIVYPDMDLSLFSLLISCHFIFKLIVG